MFSKLNASGFNFNDKIYHLEFENVLAKLIATYKQMLVDKVNLNNDENSIRDCMLYQYLKNSVFKKANGITDYLFDKELEENSGRIDIRVMPVNPFVSDDAYYILECKRLNSKNQSGKTGLNGEYIAEGICRFVAQKYSCYHKTNGMLGFVVENIDIDKNTLLLNGLLKSHFPEANTNKDLIKRVVVEGFEFSFFSIHSCNSDDITLYHLMFNFSKNMQKRKIS